MVSLFLNGLNSKNFNVRVKNHQSSIRLLPKTVFCLILVAFDNVMPFLVRYSGLCISCQGEAQQISHIVTDTD